MLKKLEVLANVIVVVTASTLCALLVKKHLLPTSKSETVAARTVSESPFASAPRRSSIERGTKISLPGVTFGKGERTLVLALSTTCRYCTESAPFYRKIQEQKPSDLRLVAVFPQSVDDGRNYLSKLGVLVSEVVQTQLPSINISGTPTLILTDQDGIVKDLWVGRLSDAEAAKVTDQIATPAGK